MKRPFSRPLSPLVVPGYLDIRSENSPNSPDSPKDSKDPPSPKSPGSPTLTSVGVNTATAVSSTDAISSSGLNSVAELTAAKDISVSRSSTEVVVVVVTLILLLGLIAGAIVVYKKKDSKVSDYLGCLKKRSKDKAVHKDVPDSTSGTNLALSDGASTLVDEKDRSLEPSSQGTGGFLQKLQGFLPGSNKKKESTGEFGVRRTIDEDQSQVAAQAAPKVSLAQKLQGIIGGFKRKPGPQWPSDLERAAVPSQESGPVDTGNTAVEWPGRPSSVAGHSIRTESSMALHPALARIKSVKKTELRPGLSAFSWSTNMPTPIPPSHHSTKDNPLPPVPSSSSNEQEVNNRDSVLTTMTEDFQPTRYRNIDSWVGNVQERHDRHAANQEMPTPAPESAELQVPSAVADVYAQQRDTRGSVRMSALASEGMPTPAIETATMAFTMPVRARAVGEHQEAEQQPQQAVQTQQPSWTEAQHPLSQISEVPSEGSTTSPPLAQDQDQDIPVIAPITSPSETITIIHEEDWIPNVTRYPSGTTSVSGFPGWKAGEEPPVADR